MTSTSSSAPLERGKACLRCRGRKMRCDGVRPACGQCVRADDAADCEYADGHGPTASQLLEHRKTYLEGRIAEIESARGTSLTLYDPYEAFHQSQGSTGTGRPYQMQNQTQHTLMRSFFRQSSEVGFFLHIPRFLQVVSTPPTSGYPSATSLLLNVIYLLGAQFSSDPQTRAQQPGYLSRAIEQLTASLSAPNAAGIVYVLQAEILLSYYFMDNNRSVEGIYHSKAAASIVMASRLHQIRSSRGQVAPTGISGRAQYTLSPSADFIQEGERINAFWSVFILDKCWSVALGSSSALIEDESKGTVIDVLWPLDIGSYESHPLPAGLRGSHTVQVFLQSPGTDVEQSVLALHAKAACLYAYANHLASRWDPRSTTFQTRFSQLDSRIEQFKRTLPPVHRVDPTRLDIIRNLLVVYALSHCATLNLYRPAEQQAIVLNGRSWNAASAAVSVLQRIDMSAINYINPIMGMLLTTVANVLSRGIMTARSQNVINAANQSTFIAPLNQILSALDRWSAASPLTSQQRTVIQQTLAGL